MSAKANRKALLQEWRQHKKSDTVLQNLTPNPNTATTTVAVKKTSEIKKRPQVAVEETKRQTKRLKTDVESSKENVAPKRAPTKPPVAAPVVQASATRKVTRALTKAKTANESMVKQMPPKASLLQAKKQRDVKKTMKRHVSFQETEPTAAEHMTKSLGDVVECIEQEEEEMYEEHDSYVDLSSPMRDVQMDDPSSYSSLDASSDSSSLLPVLFNDNSNVLNNNTQGALQLTVDPSVDATVSAAAVVTSGDMIAPTELIQVSVQERIAQILSSDSTQTTTENRVADVHTGIQDNETVLNGSNTINSHSDSGSIINATAPDWDSAVFDDDFVCSYENQKTVYGNLETVEQGQDLQFEIERMLHELMDRRKSFAIPAFSPWKDINVNPNRFSFAPNTHMNRLSLAGSVLNLSPNMNARRLSMLPPRVGRESMSKPQHRVSIAPRQMHEVGTMMTPCKQSSTAETSTDAVEASDVVKQSTTDLVENLQRAMDEILMENQQMSMALQAAVVSQETLAATHNELRQFAMMYQISKATSEELEVELRNVKEELSEKIHHLQKTIDSMSYQERKDNKRRKRQFISESPRLTIEEILYDSMVQAEPICESAPAAPAIDAVDVGAAAVTELIQNQDQHMAMTKPPSPLSSPQRQPDSVRPQVIDELDDAFSYSQTTAESVPVPVQVLIPNSPPRRSDSTLPVFLSPSPSSRLRVRSRASEIGCLFSPLQPKPLTLTASPAVPPSPVLTSPLRSRYSGSSVGSSPSLTTLLTSRINSLEEENAHLRESLKESQDEAAALMFANEVMLQQQISMKNMFSEHCVEKEAKHKSEVESMQQLIQLESQKWKGVMDNTVATLQQQLALGLQDTVNRLKSTQQQLQEEQETNRNLRQKLQDSGLDDMETDAVFT
eukprot:GILK01009627.1.p1 GENE.GILK01009627.1~~GILK01009627.1.p1  ORF type:complete len:916 (-),score=243.09 GILK01009627.1:216-2909(-)